MRWLCYEGQYAVERRQSGPVTPRELSVSRQEPLPDCRHGHGARRRKVLDMSSQTSKSLHHYHVMTHRRRFTIFPHLPRMLSFNARLNTSFTLSPAFAEHSIYSAPISRATIPPCSRVTGIWPCALNIRRVWSSLRRSVLVATRISGTPSQKCATSGNHCVVRTVE